tara:strand:- start:1067 stop:1609 length:543 start_codon:yes stop_codon:yes gene_type:complete
MDKFTINKIIASIVLTLVIVVGINKLANTIYNVKTPDNNTYKVAKANKIKKDNNNEDVKNVAEVDISALLALGNIEQGKKAFRQCAACHSISKGGGNKIGPALWGVIGRNSGSLTDYKYSKAMSNFNKIWNFESMNAFLIKPKDYIKGTKMAYAGLKKEDDRASIILYLNEQSDSPLQLP